MKVFVSYGFIIIMSLILGITFFTFATMKTGNALYAKMFNTFGFGFFTALLMVLGLFTLDQGFYITIGGKK